MKYQCFSCNYLWTSRKNFGSPAKCPSCNSKKIKPFPIKPFPWQLQDASVKRRKGVELQTLKIHSDTTVKKFAELMGIRVSDLLVEFMKLGLVPNINQPIDIDAACLVAYDYGFKLEIIPVEEKI